jgi:hypothetical protein
LFRTHVTEFKKYALASLIYRIMSSERFLNHVPGLMPLRACDRRANLASLSVLFRSNLTEFKKYALACGADHVPLDPSVADWNIDSDIDPLYA